MICAVQVISVELDIGRSEKQHKEKEASHKFMLREETPHCRGQEKVSRLT